MNEIVERLKKISETTKHHPACLHLYSDGSGTVTVGYSFDADYHTVIDLTNQRDFVVQLDGWLALHDKMTPARAIDEAIARLQKLREEL